MHEKNYSLDTLAVHAGYTPDSAEHCLTVPIYATSAYAFESAEFAASLFDLSASGSIYSRISNPTVAALEQRVNALEGGVGALAMASGHASIYNMILNLASTGDDIVSAIQIYGGAINMLSVTLGNSGVKTTFVDGDDFDAWEKAITTRTKAFFVEVVGNPNANVCDLERIADIAHRHGIPLIADSTFATPYLIRPFDFGADFVVHSATKYLCGNGTVLGGITVDSGKFPFMGNPRFPQYNNPDPSYHGFVFGDCANNSGFITRLRTLLLRDTGACLSPFNAFLILGGIETLHLRMKRHCENATAVAKYLEQHPQVSFVSYPLLESSPYRARAEKYLPNGAGSVFTFGLKGGRAAGLKFINSVELFMHVANVGDTRSLVIHPATTTHSQLNDEQLVSAGISPDTVRISVGIEDANDLIADLEQAIAKTVGL